MVKRFAWYPADNEKRDVRRKKAHPTKLRKGIVAGTVLILLSGRFRGKRVVFLKQLPSGLLLVTGPHKVNGVPVKRVNQAYTLTTSTKVNISGVDVSKVNDDTFKKGKVSHGRDFFAQGGSAVSKHCKNMLTLFGVLEEGSFQGTSKFAKRSRRCYREES